MIGYLVDHLLAYLVGLLQATNLDVQSLDVSVLRLELDLARPHHLLEYFKLARELLAFFLPVGHFVALLLLGLADGRLKLVYLLHVLLQLGLQVSHDRVLGRQGLAQVVDAALQQIIRILLVLESFGRSLLETMSRLQLFLQRIQLIPQLLVFSIEYLFGFTLGLMGCSLPGK